MHDITVIAAPAPNSDSFPAPFLWLIAFIASLIAVALFHLIKRLGKKSSTVRTIASAFELLCFGSAAAALASTPLVQSITRIAQGTQKQAGNAAASHGFVAGPAIIALIIVLIFAIVYQQTSNMVWGIVFGLAVLILAVFLPDINQLLGWWTDNIVAPVYRGALHLLGWTATRRVS